MIFEMMMGMVNRGAYLGWISQYPHEREILIPPLCGLEVLSSGQLTDGTIIYRMGLNLNLRSMTIEQVLAARKKQYVEIVELVQKDIAARSMHGDMPRRRARVQHMHTMVQDEESHIYNDNAHFANMVSNVLGELPRAGDCVAVLPQRGVVLALDGGTTSTE
eukprot:SAG11_NODE_14744_length_601_cov_0.822709_1_plen_161_part_10